MPVLCKVILSLTFIDWSPRSLHVPERIVSIVVGERDIRLGYEPIPSMDVLDGTIGECIIFTGSQGLSGEWSSIVGGGTSAIIVTKLKDAVCMM
jgi:hypothetical protein